MKQSNLEVESWPLDKIRPYKKNRLVKCDDANNIKDFNIYGMKLRQLC